MVIVSLQLQVASEKVFGVDARRVQIPSEEVLGALGLKMVCDVIDSFAKRSDVGCSKATTNIHPGGLNEPQENSSLSSA